MNYGGKPPLGSMCMVCTKAGIRCRRRPVVRAHGIDACTQHAQMIREGLVVHNKLASDIPSEPGVTGDHCAVCHGEIRQYVDGGDFDYIRYVHRDGGAFWTAQPHRVVPVWKGKRPDGDE